MNDENNEAWNIVIGMTDEELVEEYNSIPECSRTNVYVYGISEARYAALLNIEMKMRNIYWRVTNEYIL